MEDRERRIGENEILYRSVNEKITDLNAAFGDVTDTLTVVCECGNLACAEQIELALGDYERVRADATHFVIVPGHEVEDVEDVVEEHEHYAVVAKRAPEAAEVARETDPRS